ncbi:MFS transporter [Francisella salina]|uniref:Trehalose permease, MFS family, FucP subfamily n=1 Tax=Francisella salina TaxID=573569 RepID=A0ABM5M9V1_FRAST|nr:MFS transporter [Francisella salina]AEI35926.1 Putative trehalose permease, MFS family, FucP subfamily [Francisella salina]
MKYFQLKLSLFLIFFISAILLNSVGIVILQSVTHYQVTEVQASILEACKDLTIAIVSFAICSFIPRFGYKNAMLLGLAIIAIGCITMAGLDSFFTAKLLFVLIGVAFALIKVSVYSTVGLITNDSKAHASLMSLLEGVFQVGVVLCFFVFSIFIHFGNWLGTYWLLAGLCLVAFLLLLFTKLDESAVRTSKNSNFLADTLSMLKLIKLPIVMLFIISVFFYVFIEQGVQSWLPTFNTRVLHLSTSTSVFMASIFALSIAAGRITFGFIMKKIDWKLIIIIGLICCGILVISTLQLSKLIDTNQTDSYLAVVIALLFPMIGFFMAPIYPTLCSSILSSQPENLQSAMAGLIIIFSALGGTIGSRIISEIFAHFGGVTAFYCVLIPIALLVLLIPPYAKLHRNK